MKFLAFSDMHYSDVPMPGERNRTKSLEKVKRALEEHSDGCDFVVNFGDTADLEESGRNQTALWEETADVLKNSGKKYYCLIGNHDTSTDKQTWLKIMGMPSRYYAFTCDGYRVLVLDANQNSTCDGFPKSEISWDNCYIDDEQFEWIKKELDRASGDVLIFTHELFVLKERSNNDDHVIRNRDKVIDLFEKSGKVKAVFAGHYHWGDVSFSNGINYITFRSVCLYDDYAHAVVSVDKSGIKVQGYSGQACVEIEF